MSLNYLNKCYFEVNHYTALLLLVVCTLYDGQNISLKINESILLLYE